MKQCKSCFEVKPLTEFYTNGKHRVSGRTKYKPSCRLCEELDRRSFVEEKKRILSEMFGDRCSVCSYDRCQSALEFHHVDPSVKEYTPAKLVHNFSSIERMLDEVSKCVLVCANCHREIHEKLRRA